MKRATGMASDLRRGIISGAATAAWGQSLLVMADDCCRKTKPRREPRAINVVKDRDDVVVDAALRNCKCFAWVSKERPHASVNFSADRNRSRLA